MNFIKIFQNMQKYVLVKKSVLEEVNETLLDSKQVIQELQGAIFMYNKALLISCDGDEKLAESILKGVEAEVVDVLKKYYDEIFQKS